MELRTIPNMGKRGLRVARHVEPALGPHSRDQTLVVVPIRRVDSGGAVEIVMPCEEETEAVSKERLRNQIGVVTKEEVTPHRGRISNF